VPHLPRVVSPIQPLFERDGIQIALISIEVWQERLVVRLAALPSETTGDQQRRHEGDFERWGERLVAAGKEVAGNPPEQPGTRLLAPLQLTVEDDAGTTYTARSANTGGTGSEWHGDWFFVGSAPSVGRLTVRVSSPEGEAATVALDLSRP
jgi:hypothetical protein